MEADKEGKRIYRSCEQEWTVSRIEKGVSFDISSFWNAELCVLDGGRSV